MNGRAGNEVLRSLKPKKPSGDYTSQERKVSIDLALAATSEKQLRRQAAAYRHWQKGEDYPVWRA